MVFVVKRQVKILLLKFVLHGLVVVAEALNHLEEVMLANESLVPKVQELKQKSIEVRQRVRNSM